MTTNDFTEAARAEAERRDLDRGVVGVNNRAWFRAGARWARDHLAAQEPDGPRMAPFGLPVTADGVREVWDAFVKPSQADDAPPQSIEMRELMAILRWAHTRLSPEESPAARSVGRGAR